MKYRNLLMSVVLVVLVLAMVVVAMVVRHRMGVREYRRYLTRRQEIDRAYTDHAPPPDFHKWIQEFGANEPDPSTDAGRAALESERARLPAAKEKLRWLVDSLPTVFVSEDETAENVFLSDFLQTFDGFSRASCAELLRSIRWSAWSGDVKILLESSGTRLGATVIKRYYRIFCRMGDQLWIKGGLEHEAAEADYWILDTLKRCRDQMERRKWFNVVTAIDQCLQHWKEFRCDSESSNFCRAHRFWEERYNLYYRDRVRRGETNWLKLLSAYYRHHLEVARWILNREPKWSPGAGRGLYDDAPELKKEGDR